MSTGELVRNAGACAPPRSPHPALLSQHLSCIKIPRSHLGNRRQRTGRRGVPGETMPHFPWTFCFHEISLRLPRHFSRSSPKLTPPADSSLPGITSSWDFNANLLSRRGFVLQCLCGCFESTGGTIFIPIYMYVYTHRDLWSCSSRLIQLPT